ncbi:MAG: SEC-C domain-containing protein, partial [Deltaproteobacteria bacterium]|nr:SEC-C domain-containing protein [Deltaproteobacteria bacterium]
ATDDIVEFIARYKARGADLHHHERSTFAQQDGEWFYRDGQIVKPKTVVKDSPKVGRNSPCPCGSGKKYKKCCGA